MKVRGIAPDLHRWSRFPGTVFVHYCPAPAGRFHGCVINRRLSAIGLATALALAPLAPATADMSKPVIILKLSFSKLVVGKPVVQSPRTLKTDMNAAADITSTTPTICSVTPGKNGPVVTGLKVGTCTLKAYAMGMKGKFPSATKYYGVPVVNP